MIEKEKHLGCGEDCVNLLQNYRSDVVVFQGIKAGFSCWKYKDIVIFYKEIGLSWFTSGGPVGPTEAIPEAAEKFIAYAQSHGKRVRFVAVEDLSWASSRHKIVELGLMPLWKSEMWPDVLQSSQSLRKQLRRSQAKGVEVVILAGSDLQNPSNEGTKRQLEKVKQEWFSTRLCPPLDFLLVDQIFSYSSLQCYFIARRGCKVLAFLNAATAFRDGWFVENVFRSVDCPNGTTELLFDSVMRSANAAGVSVVTLGLTPLVGTSNDDKFLKAVRRFAGNLYNFEGLYAFRSRLRPSRWKPVYLVIPNKGSRLLALIDLALALMPRTFWKLWIWEKLKWKKR